MTRLVVIGRSGQVATELRRKPLPNGWSLISLGRDELDLRRLECLYPSLAAHEPDIVVNAAAYTSVDLAEAEEGIATLVNGKAIGELARTAATFGIPLISLSTDYVFNGETQKPWTEEDEPHPLNAYGRSKLAGESAILGSNARAVILRTSWVFSPHGSNFVKTMLRLGMERDELPVVSDQHGGPTPADRIAAAVLTIAKELILKPVGEKLGLFHFSGIPSTSWAGFADAIFEGADWLRRKPAIRPITTAEYPTAAKRPCNSILDCSKIRKVYYLEQPDWRSALHRTLDELRPKTTTTRLP
jgi:dTDP-4-dehydrorhamnose reductase